MMETSHLVQLIRQMGHDMRVPLNTLISTTDMLAEGSYDPLTAKQARAVARLQRSNQRLLAIVDDFVTYVKASAGEIGVDLKPFSPRLLIEECSNRLSAAASEKGVSLQISTSEDVPETLLGDQVLLSRILLALLWNALSFTAQGNILITSTWTDDHEWQVSVKDSGSGIPDEALPHIYEAFWRGEERPQVPTAGAGLGLPLALALAKTMNGNLWLKDTGRNGSTFCLQLPLVMSDDKS